MADATKELITAVTMCIPLSFVLFSAKASQWTSSSDQASGNCHFTLRLNALSFSFISLIACAHSQKSAFHGDDSMFSCLRFALTKVYIDFFAARMDQKPKLIDQKD